MSDFETHPVGTGADLIARAEASLEGVTPGPWTVAYERGCTHLKMSGHGSQMCDETYYPWVPENMKDWEFFAASRQLVPDLIAALRAALRAAEARAERAEAMVAAAYRDSAQVAHQKAKFTPEAMQKATGAEIMANLVQVTESRTAYVVETAILALIPADAQAALDRVKQHAADEALERAEQVAADYWREMHNPTQKGPVAAAIRALKGDVTDAP